MSRIKNSEISALTLFHDGGPYHIENSPLVSRANQWAGFYIIRISAMKELSYFVKQIKFFSNLDAKSVTDNEQFSKTVKPCPTNKTLKGEREPVNILNEYFSNIVSNLDI